MSPLFLLIFTLMYKTDFHAKSRKTILGLASLFLLNLADSANLTSIYPLPPPHLTQGIWVVGRFGLIKSWEVDGIGDAQDHFEPRSGAPRFISYVMMAVKVGVCNYS